VSKAGTIGGSLALGLLSSACLTLVGGFDFLGDDAGTKPDATTPKPDAPSRDAPLDVTYELGNTPCPGLACDGGLCIVTADPEHCGTCENDCTRLPNIEPTGIACELGSCIYTCKSGFPDCDKTGTGCTDRSTDPVNCGQCGHSCLGGACVASVCGPATFFDGTGIGASITDLATDGTAVVWGNATDGSVDFVEMQGGTNIVLAGATTGAPYPPVNVAIADKLVAYTLFDGVNAYQGSATAGKAGSGVLENTLPMSVASGLAFDKAGDTVFFLQYSMAEINLASCMPSATGCSTLTSVGSTAMGSNVVVDGTPHHAVFGDIGNRAVIVYSFTHAMATPIPSQPSASWVATDGTNAYWGSTVPGSPPLYPILSASLSNPTSVTSLLTTSAGACTGVATDGTFVYFAAGSGIYSVPIGGATSPKLLTATATARHLKYANKSLFFDDGTKIYVTPTP
jgi:hypothetical protein